MEFKTVKAVYAYLKEQNAKVTMTTLYNHAKTGRLRKRGKVFHQDDVDLYAHTIPKEHEDGINVSDMTLRKQAADIARAEEDVRLKRLRADTLAGKLVPADLYEQSLAAKAALLKRGLLSMCHGLAVEAVEVVEGDPSKGSLLLDMLLKAVNRHLHQYALDTEFTVDAEEIEAILDVKGAV